MDGATFHINILNPAETTITYGAHDEYGGYASRTFKLTGKGDVTRSVPENSPAGTAVGDPVTGTPYGEEETLTYTLTGEASTSGAFEIDSSSGQISVKQGASLDYETKNSYTGQVSWTVQNQVMTASLTINVTDVAPGKPDAPPVTRTQFSEQTAPALDVTWTAAAANGLTITGYEAQYRKKVAQGEEANAWTAYTGTLSATATTFNLAGLEAGATYEAQVRAVSSEEGAGPWSDIGEGRANRPPTLGPAHLVSRSYPHYSSGYAEFFEPPLPNGPFFKDADGDAMYPSGSSQYPGIVRVTVEGAYVWFFYINPGKSTVTYGVHDHYGGYAFRTVDYTVTSNWILKISENSPAGTQVQDRPVEGTPYGDDPFVYTLTGEAATSGAFVIDSATGWISVAEGATLDYEAKSSYAGKVNWTVDGQAAVANLTINVTDVTAPGKPDAPTVNQSTTNPATTLDVAWTAPDDNGGGAITDYDVQYREKGDEAWIDHAFTGTQTSTTFTGLTQDTTYEVQVRASNVEGTSEWSDSGEGATASPTPPSVTPPTTPLTPPSAPTVAISLPTTFKDLQAMNVTFRFSADVTGFDASDVTVENGTLGSLSGSGRVYTSTVTPNGDGNVTVTVAADAAVASGVSGPPTATSEVSTYLWIRLEGPTGPRLSWDSFEVVATFSEPPGDAMGFEHWNVEDDVPVSIEGTTATFTLTPEYYKYRWGTWPYRSRIWVNWRGLSAYFEVYSDADRPRVHRITGPTATQTEPFSIHIQLTEDAVGFAAGDLTVVNGEVAEFRQLGAWDYEADITPTRSGRLTVDIAAGAFQDLVGWDNTAARQWSVNIDLSPPTPDAPTVTQSTTSPTTSLDVAWTAPDVAEGSLPITDYDVEYRKKDDEAWTDHAFTGTQTSTTLTGLIKDTNYQVRVRAQNSDGAGSWSSPGEGKTKAGARSVTFPDQASQREVAENSPAGTPVGDAITAIDNEGHPLTYTLKTPSSIFALDANTGQITVAQGASLDHEAQSTYTVVVEASDGVGVVGQGGNSIVSAEVTVTITVTDVNEAPPRPDAPSVTQSSSSPTSALDVAWTEPDMTGKPAITDYDVRYRTQGETEWTDHAFTGTGTQTTLSGLAKDTAYEVQVLARNDEGDSPWSDSGSDSTTPSVSIHSPGDPVGEGSSVDLPVSLSSPVNAIVTVSWSTGGGSGSGSLGASAADGASGSSGRAMSRISAHEHEPSSGTVTFQPGQTTATITINILDDEEHEDPESFSIVLTEVTVSSPDDEVSMGRRTATVTIADNDAAPKFTESGPASRSVKENTPPGRAIGAPIAAADAEDDPLTYTLSGADAHAFTLDGATGQLWTKTRLDFETRRTYDALTVTVDDGHGHTDTRSLTVSVTDVNEPPAKPAAPAVLHTASNPSSTLGVTWTAPDMRSKPAITDYDVRYRVAGAAEWTDTPSPARELRPPSPA